MANEFKIKKGLIITGSGGIILDIQGSQGSLFNVNSDSNTTVYGPLTADMFKVPNGTSNQSLMADGSLLTISVPTLQQVTDIGNTTTNPIVVADSTSIGFISKDTMGIVNLNTDNAVSLFADKIESIRVDDGFISTINVINEPPTQTATYIHTKPNKSGTYAMVNDIQTLTAGSGIDITNDVISATGGGGSGVSLLRQEFNFTNSQSFTLNSNYSQVYAIVVQGVTLSNSQYSLNGTNGFTILDPLTEDDFIVVIYALNIGGVTPSYTKAEVDALINAELNIPTAGNILRGNGAEFLSIPEVEFMRNLAIYQKAPDSKFFDNKQLIAWDSFDRPNENPINVNDSGQTYSLWRGADRGEILNKNFSGNNGFIETSAIFTIPNTKNIGIEFSMSRSTLGGQMTGIALVKDDNNYIAFGRFSKSESLGVGSVFTELPFNADYSLFVVINGVSTTIGSISQQTMYAGGGMQDSFLGSRLNFVIKYGNRGRSGNSSLVVQSLDNPALRIDVNVSQFNSTFVTPADYNRIALISNVSSASRIQSYKIANLEL